MTRQLSQLLQANELDFHHAIARLEAASGYLSHDIRLSSDLDRITRDKIASLNLDPNDTTDEELYQALQHKIRRDDQELIKKIRTLSAINVAADGDISAGIVYSVNSLAKEYSCFTIKGYVLKKLIKLNPPKKLMKLLGYRSIESMLKHEQPNIIVAIASKVESNSWINQYRTQLKHLKSSDCEQQKVNLSTMNGDKWSKIGQRIIDDQRITVIVNKETASILVLPLVNENPANGLTIATLSLTLEALNSLVVISSYLGLSQLASDFGDRLALITAEDPVIGISLIDNNLSWQMIHRFLYRISSSIESLVDMPIDLHQASMWQPIELLISKIEPNLNFWKDTNHLCRLNGAKNSPVSFNVIDNAINLCNKHQFTNQTASYAQQSLWQELVMRYIRPELLTEAINRQLQPKLVSETISQ